MPQTITPTGELIPSGAKSFTQIQSENLAALKAGLVEMTECGKPAKQKDTSGLLDSAIKPYPLVEK